MKPIFISVCLWIFATLSGGVVLAQAQVQVPTTAIGLQATYAEGNILLRWAPTNPVSWTAGNQDGYILERKVIHTDQNPEDNPFVVLHSDVLKPLSLEAFQQQAEAGASDYLWAAAECIYGEGPEATEMAGNWVEASDQLANRFSIALFSAEMDFGVAKASGLAFQDEDIENGQMYLYRLSLIGKDGLPSKETYLHVVATQKEAFIPSLLDPQELENKVVLHWNRKLHQKHFSAYWIEKSLDGENWERINALPYVHGQGQAGRIQTQVISYQDSVPNYQMAYYRLVGIDAFGMESFPSIPLQAMGRDRTPPARVENLKSEVLPDGSVELTWDLPESAVDDLSGYRVLRAFDYQGEWLPLSKALIQESTTSFIDSFPNFVGINYYKVIAEDSVGNQAASFPVTGFIEDQDPPASPVAPKAFMDSMGHMTLTWTPNSEPDVAGYKVFFANHPKEVPTSLTQRPVADTFFHDTLALNILTEKAYYRLVAVDRRGNTSDFSPWSVVKRPDTIRPAMAVFTDYELKETQITLRWIPSSSQDVQVQMLERRKKDGEWTLMTQLNPKVAQWTDESMASNTRYQYRIKTEDDAQLFQYSNVLTLQSKRSTSDLSLEANPMNEQKQVQLTWQGGEDHVYQWILYRAEGEGPLTRIARLAGTQDRFEDQSVKEGILYAYALRAVYQDGAQSPLGTKVMAKLSE